MKKYFPLALLSLGFASPAFCEFGERLRELQRSVNTLVRQRQTIEDNQNNLSTIQAEHSRRIGELTNEVEKIKDNNGKVGEIRYSILNIEQFQRLYGNSWVLMDGRVVPANATLAGLGIANVPDARGVFLRCKNHGRTDQGNPEGDLDIGTYQGDELRSHDHRSRTTNLMFISWTPNHQHLFCFPQDGGNPLNKLESLRVAESKMACSSSVGGSETRPRCITVNAFIKIHDARDLPTRRRGR